MSPGRVECGPGMFSTAGARASSGVPGARRATVAMAAMTVHAPVLSIFISSIRSAGLDADAARVEADALADDREMPVEGVALAFLARAQDDHPGRVVAPPPDRHEHAHPELGRLLRTDDVDPEAVLLGDGAGLVGEDLGADVVGGAVRERPGEVGALADDRRHARRRPSSDAASRARRDEDQLIEVAAAAIRPPRGRSTAGRRSPGRCLGPPARRRRGSPPSMASASGDSQTASRWTVRPPSRRSAAAATRTIASRSRPRVTETDGKEPARGELAA